ncbi:MAG: hypothetical protein RMK65_02100 [Anaerolineae bacterium]|nr:hypothetical protein [Anaerolineae bacterium]MDW7990936.1 hypothetical protein [Anaerolineae bacterium]
MAEVEDIAQALKEYFILKKRLGDFDAYAETILNYLQRQDDTPSGFSDSQE